MILDKDCAAVHSLEQSPLFHLAQVAPDRRNADVQNVAQLVHSNGFFVEHLLKDLLVSLYT
jgi:hypothetical protein